jgi:hypothetical protein
MVQLQLSNVKELTLPIETLKARLLRQSIDSNGCRVWLGGKGSTGYGYIKIDHSQRLVHRVAYEVYKGAIPEGYQIDHLCKNTSCINPQHLEAVTQRENILRSNSFAAINSKKTECINGHSLIGDNVYIKPNGARNCKECRKITRREYYKTKELNYA